MYGWRGRLGLIIPADNSIVEVEFPRHLPPGVSLHVARLSAGGDRQTKAQEALSHVSSLGEVDVATIGYMCAASTFMLAAEANRQLCTQISGMAGGTPAFTASTAMTDALHAVGVKTISVLSPHPPEVAQHLNHYLTAAGFEVNNIAALDLTLREINRMTPEAIYPLARAAITPGSDGLFVAATNLRALEIVSHLESDLGMPVVTSNSACLWKALSLIGLVNAADGLGSLTRPL